MAVYSSLYLIMLSLLPDFDMLFSGFSCSGLCIRRTAAAYQHTDTSIFHRKRQPLFTAFPVAAPLTAIRKMDVSLY